ncbi:N-(5'-phosphoribosyl)anthranilate isomerase [Actinomycetota bacterium]
MVWIKICGITNNDDAEVAVRCGADALGFIFSTDSPRRISLEVAGGIIDYLQDISERDGRENTEDTGISTGTVEKVGVFVNEELEKVVSFSRQLKLDYIQLSGDESTYYIKKLKEEIPDIKVIKAIRIDSGVKVQAENVKKTVKEFRSPADHILMDSYHPTKYGGTGKTLDLKTIKSFGSITGFILSGGLDHLNIGEAIRNIRPFGIDVSSRLESSPGKKDHLLVKNFIEAARSAVEEETT